MVELLGQVKRPLVVVEDFIRKNLISRKTESFHANNYRKFEDFEFSMKISKMCDRVQGWYRFILNFLHHFKQMFTPL